MRKFHAALVRGGAAKGLFFLKKDLPENQEEWKSIFLQGIGDQNPLQMDGVGGQLSTNSKVIVVWPSDKPGVDVEYIHSQIEVGCGKVNFNANCGNLTTAVGLFAMEENLATPTDPVTTVRAFNHNVNQYIDILVPTKDEKPEELGNFSIDGVSGTGPKIVANYLSPGGSKTGRLFPTGNPIDVLEVDGFGKIESTLIDVSNPLVLVRGTDLGVSGVDMPTDMEARPELLPLIEKIRAVACCRMGIAKTPDEATRDFSNMPFIGLFNPPTAFTAINGTIYEAEDMDISMRMISARLANKAQPIVCANAIAVALEVPGTLLSNALPGHLGKNKIRIGHPSGVLSVYPKINIENGKINIEYVGSESTARRIMDGTLYIKY